MLESLFFLLCASRLNSIHINQENQMKTQVYLFLISFYLFSRNREEEKHKFHLNATSHQNKMCEPFGQWFAAGIKNTTKLKNQKKNSKSIFD